MRLRQYSLELPEDLDKRLKQALQTVKDRGLLPEHTTERDFLVATVFTNGLAMVEADLVKRERAERSVLLPGEIEWPNPSQSMSQSPISIDPKSPPSSRKAMMFGPPPRRT